MNAFKFKPRMSIFFIIFMLFMGLTYIKTLSVFPQNLMIMKGKEYVYDFNTPINVRVAADKEGVLKLNGVKANNNKINLSSPLKIKSQKTGKVNLRFKLFGKIPLRTVTVNVVPKSKVKPCGQTVGVKIHTKGILVIGTSSVTGVNGREYKPSKNNIKQGDIILRANGKQLDDVKDLSNIVLESKGNFIKLTIKREQQVEKVKIKPVKSLNEKKYRLGLWVKDSTSGIGTLTFYNPKTMNFAALGHGIIDIDTGTLLNVDKGHILQSNIISVKKGRRGIPGELKGIFLKDDFKKGKIIKNNKHGIYGKITNPKSLPQNSKAMPVALRNDVKEGPAVILSNVNGEKVESFTIYIQEVLKNNYYNSKNMVIKITDPRLLKETGGIVQGMSGSPIIQNGKLVGAVTHVFVNDSTKGYGIFAESMLKSLNNMENK